MWRRLTDWIEQTKRIPAVPIEFRAEWIWVPLVLLFVGTPAFLGCVVLAALGFKWPLIVLVCICVLGPLFTSEPVTKRIAAAASLTGAIVFSALYYFAMMVLGDFWPLRALFDSEFGLASFFSLHTLSVFPASWVVYRSIRPKQP